MGLDAGRLLTLLLVMLRMTGILVLNPIMGRRNIPTMVNVGLAMMTAFMLLDTVETPLVTDPSVPYFALMVFRELAIGFAAGIIFQMFLAVLIVGGEVIDMGLGISMAKAFDPGTNASISISSSFFYAMLVITFFATSNHLTFFRMMAYTFRVLPAGQIALNLDNFMYLPELFSTALVFAMKLALPVVVIEIIISLAVGVIMRIIPQINVFVLSIQFKLFAGILVLVILVGPFIAYFGNLVQFAFESLQDALDVMFQII